MTEQMKDMAKKTQDPIVTIKDLLDRSKKEFALALPRHLDADRFVRIAFTTIRNIPELQKCTITSLLGSLMQAAQLGLEPDGILGHAYLIPYNKKAKDGAFYKEVQLQIGYKGLIALARRSGEVRSINAQVVFENDEFEFEYGLDEKLRHVPSRGDRGRRVAVYAVAHFKDGGHAFEVMFEPDIEKIRKSSRAGDKDGKPIGIWADYTDEMWRKTCVRRLAKYLPLSVEFQRAAELDERAELGLDDVVPAIEARTAERTDALRERLAETVKDASATASMKQSE